MIGCPHFFCCSSIVLSLQAGVATVDAPAFQTFRWDEDHRYLNDLRQLSAYERLKYQPFVIAEQTGYFTLGGTLRSRVNVYNELFGLQGGQDGEQWLQRFYGHMDICISNGLRMFAELSANYADASGDLVPGPFDKDKAAMGQAFIDWQTGNVRWRLGRQEMGLGRHG